MQGGRNGRQVRHRRRRQKAAGEQAGEARTGRLEGQSAPGKMVRGRGSGAG